MKMRTLTKGAALEPKTRAYLEITACGIISPNIKISPVATIPAIIPLAIEPKKIDSTALTKTFPKIRDDKSKFPF